MHNFSDQCLDLARSLLSNNLQHINEDGSVTPAPGEEARVDEPGHAALAIGEFLPMLPSDCFPLGHQKREMPYGNGYLIQLENN